MKVTRIFAIEIGQRTDNLSFIYTEAHISYCVLMYDGVNPVIKIIILLAPIFYPKRLAAVLGLLS